MYKASYPALKNANRASALVPDYCYGISDPFIAIRERRADCMGGILAIQALRLPDDPELVTIRHSISYTDKQTGLVTPWTHYLGINRLGDVVDMHSGIQARNRSAYASEKSPYKTKVHLIDELLAGAVGLAGTDRKLETLIDDADIRTAELHRLVFIDTDKLLEYASPGKTMGELSSAAFEALEELQASVV
jgi:hypothetical protein